MITVEETYTLGGDKIFLYSKYSAYIHETKIGITPSKNETWGIISKARQKIDEVWFKTHVKQKQENIRYLILNWGSLGGITSK